MNISWLRKFIVPAGYCNYLKAAERLFISQSTLSKHTLCVPRYLFAGSPCFHGILLSTR